MEYIAFVAIGSAATSALSAMDSAKLHGILGGGDEGTWKLLTGHSHSFLYAEVDEKEQVVSINELAWDPTQRRPRALPTGALGWVVCKQNSVAGRALSSGQTFRVHVCRECPCTAVYHPSKYGGLPPPLMHGRVLRRCDESEVVSLEKEWATLQHRLRDGETSAVAEGAAVAAPTIASADVEIPALPPISSTVVENTACPHVLKLPADLAQSDVPVAVAEVLSTSAVAVPVPSPSVSAAITASIMSRADQISVVGQWIGLLEIIAFCTLQKQRAILQLESGTLDVVAELAPSLMDSTWELMPFEGRIVACKLVGSVWQPASLVTCRHFVAAKPLGHALHLHGDGVVAHMGRLGFAAVMTQANGDCGIESLLVLADRRRGEPERLTLRKHLQQFLYNVAEQQLWHDIFAAAGETVAEFEYAPVKHPPGDSSAMAECAEVEVAPVPFTGGHGESLHNKASAEVESPAPCEVIVSQGISEKTALPVKMADATDSALRAAISWSAGVSSPTAGFLKRMAESLTSAEAEQLVRAHTLGEGDSTRGKGGRKGYNVKVGKKTRRSVLLSYKLGLAKAYIQWAEDRGVAKEPAPLNKGKTHGAMTRFIQESSATPLTTAQRHKEIMLLRRSLKSYYERKLTPMPNEPVAHRAVRFHLRRRVKSMAGRPVKGGVVREELYDWFCDLKRSVRGRMPIAFVLQKASTMVEDLTLEAMKRGQQVQAPVISHSWLRDWRLAYGVSFRKPNRKWKVAGPILAERLRIAWENTYRVRALALKVLGYDLDLDNLDQSPFHMNESGSKAEKSMSIRGGGVVPLKEGHAQTRERWTLQTTTTSNLERARAVPPVEVMFKAAGDRLVHKLQASIPAWAPWMTVVTAPKGSYREDDVLNFIEDRLEDMTPLRRWRILLLDAYSAHLSTRVRMCAWHKGYVVITHGGGASSVTQTNDTDLHAHVKRKYCEMEMADAIEQMRLMPTGVPCPRAADVIGWIACIWSSESLHTNASRGFLKVGLSNALDGSQDAEICREAGQFWHQQGMRQRRNDVVHDVNVEADAGRLTWCFDDVYRVINPFPVRGAKYDHEPMDKGSESDAEDDVSDSSENPADDAVAPAVAVDPALETALGEHPSETNLSHAIAVAVDTTTAVAVETTQAKLQSMQVVLHQVQAIGNMSLEAQVQKAIHLEEKRLRILGRGDAEIAHAFLEEQDAHKLKFRREQLSIRKAFEQEKQRRITIKELVEHQEQLRVRHLELRKASTVVECEKALKSWDIEDLGQGHENGGTRQHVKNRMAILERLRGRGKPLPPDLANDWHWFLKHWDAARVKHLREFHRPGWGAMFRDIVKDLLERLKRDDDALCTWMRSERARYLRAPALRL